MQDLKAFKQPAGRWWDPRHSVGIADSKTIRQLRQLEEHMTLEQVAHFR